MKTILEVGHQADLGLIRSQQEDAYALQVNPPNPLSLRTKGTIFIVADGVGGYQAGEMASRIAAGSIITKYYADFNQDVVASLKQSIEIVNKEINQSAVRDGLSRMSTTVVCAVIRDDELYVAHVGDSRAYLARNGRLIQLTTDHSWVAEQVRLGNISPEEALNHPQRNIVTRSLGIKPQVEVDVRLVGSLQDGDRLLLCTDGLYENVSEEDMLRVLQENSKPQHACGELVHLANLGGGSDNITVIVVGIRQEPSSISEETSPVSKPVLADLSPGKEVSPPINHQPLQPVKPSLPDALSNRPSTDLSSQAQVAAPVQVQQPAMVPREHPPAALQARARPFSPSLVETTEILLPVKHRLRWELALNYPSVRADQPYWSYEITLPGGRRILLAVRFSDPDQPLTRELVEIFACIDRMSQSCLLAYPGVAIESVKVDLTKNQKLDIILNLNEIVQIIENQGISITAQVKKYEWSAREGATAKLADLDMVFFIEADPEIFNTPEGV